jgi:hypothetical protein
MELYFLIPIHFHGVHRANFDFKLKRKAQINNSSPSEDRPHLYGAVSMFPVLPTTIFWFTYPLILIDVQIKKIGTLEGVTTVNVTNVVVINVGYFFFMTQQSLLGEGLLVIESYTVTRKHHTW